MHRDAAPNPETFASFGALLRFLRVRARLSLRELSIALGYSEAHLSRLEQGQRRPDPDVVRARIIPALELPPESPLASRLLALAEAHGAQAASPEAPLPPAPLPPPVGLLLTKITRPPLRRPALPRPQLLAHLDAACAVPLTLVAAPPGFGKTTLLASWLAALEPKHHPPLRAAWLSLDPSDNDPSLFVRYLVAAIQIAAPGAGAATLALLQAAPPPPPVALLTPLLNDLAALDGHLVLVLDDYHVIEALAIHEVLALVLDRAPPSLHLVLATRADPPLPLVRLRARGQLLELRARDLRFDLSETDTFLRTAMGLELEQDAVAALEARTEGWAAGLQLAALALRDRPDQARFMSDLAATSRYIAEYLAEEVLDQLPGHLRSFVLQTSILDRLSGPLCDAVLGVAPRQPAAEDAYSRLLLEELERRNMFLVPLDDARQWYRYHQLFAEAARARLRRGAPAEQVAALYRRAAAAEPSRERGVEYLLAAQLWDDAAQQILELGGAALAIGRNRTLQRWVEALPHATRAARPRLDVLLGIAVSWQGLPAEVEPLLERGLAGCVELGDVVGQGEALTQLAVLALIRGDLNGSIARIDRALLLDTAPSARLYALTFSIGAYSLAGRNEARARYADELFGLMRVADHMTLGASVLPGMHSLAVCLTGELGPLEQLCRASLASFGEQVSLAQVGVEAALAHIAWLRGRLDEARAMVARARASSAYFGTYLQAETQLLSIEGVVALACGDLEAAGALFERSLGSGLHVGLYAFALPAQLYTLARVRWQQGRTDELRVLAERLEASGVEQVALRGAMRVLLAGLIAIAEGRDDDAEQMLAPLAAREHEVGLMPIFGSAYPLLAYLALRRGEPEAAAALAPLLAACTRDDTPGRLLMEGPYVILPLRAAAAHGDHRPFAARVLALLDGP